MPIFSEAYADLKRRGLMPTTLSAAQLEILDAQVRTQAFFSARVSQLEILSGMQDLLTSLVRGESPGPGQYTDPATVRLKLKQMLAEMDYRPADPGDEGTIKDLRTDGRLNLIIQTNEKMATGLGQFLQATDPDVIDAFPAWELVRVEDRIEKRDWKARWRNAAGESGDALADQVLRRTGRMVARKDSPIWAKLSRFGIPQAPFDYNSGMDVEDVGRREALDLGVIERSTRMERPPHPGLNPQAGIAGKPANLVEVLLANLPSAFQISEDGTLTGA
jgi:hypothetical protein